MSVVSPLDEKLIMVDTSFQMASVFAEPDQCLSIRSWHLPGSELEEDEKAEHPSKPAILLMHYFGGSSREWEFIAPVLAAQDYICIAADARGHGDSQPVEVDGPASGYGVSEMAKDALIVASHSCLTKNTHGWVLVGHSMGGKAALALAATAPEGLRGLILIAPSPPTPQPMSYEERRQEIDSYGNAEASEKSATKIAVVPLPEAARNIFVEDNLRTAKSAWVAWNESGTREDISAVMPQIGLPTLLITGGKDPVIPHDVYESEVAGQLPHQPEQMVIPEGGHLITMTHSELIARKIADWAASFQS